MRPKVTIVGAGNVGGTAALLLALQGIADIVLLDIVDGLPQGKALDLSQALPVLGVAVGVRGTTDWADAAGSDLLIVTSGVARKPGMSRDDLLSANASIIGAVAGEIRSHCPDATVMVVSNPLDAMAHLTLEVTGFPRARVLGMAGVLDNARFRHFIGDALNVPAKDVEALVLGSHGDLMVPLDRLASVAGIPLADLMERAEVEAIMVRTADGGAEIVSLLGSGSAYVAPAASAVAMARAILLDERRILPCSVLLTGEYGIDGTFIGVPARVGAGGLIDVIEIDLTKEERAALGRSADAVAQLVDDMRRIMATG